MHCAEFWGGGGGYSHRDIIIIILLARLLMQFHDHIHRHVDLRLIKENHRCLKEMPLLRYL